MCDSKDGESEIDRVHTGSGDVVLWRDQDSLDEGQTPMPVVWQGIQGFDVWAYRWRKRWGGRVGALRPWEHLPVAARLAKAGVVYGYFDVGDCSVWCRFGRVLESFCVFLGSFSLRFWGSVFVAKGAK